MQDVKDAIAKALAATRKFDTEIAGTSLDMPGTADRFFLGYLLCTLDPDASEPQGVCEQLRELHRAETQREYQRTVRTEPSGLAVA